METQLLDPDGRLRIQQNKIDKIHSQIGKVEQQMMKQSSILDQLEYLHEQEEDRTQRIMDRLGKRNYLLNGEVERLYGKETTRRYSDTPLGSDVFKDIMHHRNKEHSLAQQDAAMRIRYLNIERQRLRDARERLRDRRNNLTYAPTPLGSDILEANPDVSLDMLGVATPSEHSVHSSASHVRQIVLDLPFAMDRIYRLREDLRVEYETKKRPYEGELGIESYSPWQLDDYVIVRKLVEDVVDDFLIRYIKPDINFYERDMRNAIAQQENEDWERVAGAVSERRAITLAAEEIMLMVTREMCREVVIDTIHILGTFHNLTTQMLLETVEKIATKSDKGRDPEDPAYNLVTRGYFSLQSDRNRHRKEIWSHSQHMNQAKRPVVSQPQSQPQQRQPQVEPEDEEDEDIDADVEIITYDHLTPMSLRKYEGSKYESNEVNLQKEYRKTYKKKELQYWQGLVTSVRKLGVGRKCRGVQTAQASPNGRFLAVGTSHGDVIVFDSWMEPWRPVKVIHNVDRFDDSVIHISWSLDNLRLATVNREGELIVWSFDGGGKDRTDIRGLEIQADVTGHIPQQLSRVVVLDVDQNDFTFQQGPFSEQDVLSSRHFPVTSAFFPSFTLLGTQHCVCVSLENGDILKCNLEPLSMEGLGPDVEYSEAPSIFNSNIYTDHGVNLIGQNLEADLFRHHKHPVIFIGSVDNIGNIVTVDVKGFINMWKYSRQQVSGFGWFMPLKKYRLQMSKIMYSPSSSEKPNIIFTDKVKSKRKTRQDIAKERKKADSTLQQLQLGDPWHETILEPEGLKSLVYKPKAGVKDSGAMFHVVLRHLDTNQVSSYLTRMYKPVKVACNRIIGVRQSTSGRELVFLLLFPEYPPKVAHLTVLVLDLRTMQLKDMRADIPVSVKEYQKIEQNDVVSCAVSRVLGPTGSDYLFVTISGRLQVISLNTGSLVMQSDNTDRFTFFAGNTIDNTLIPLEEDSEITTISSNGRMYAVMYSPRSLIVHILEIKDEHDHDTRRMMVKAYQRGYSSDMVGSEMRVDPMSWEQQDLQHKSVEMRKIVLEAAERAVGGGGLTEEEQEIQDVKTKTELYSALRYKVRDEGMLEGRSPEEWQQLAAREAS